MEDITRLDQAPEKMLEVDGFPVTYSTFIEMNTDDDAIPPTAEELEQLSKLEVGELMHIHVSEVKRIS